MNTRAKLTVAAVALDRVLTNAGCDVIGGTSLYRLVRLPKAHARHDVLARQHIWCRRFETAPDLLRFGLPPDVPALERLSAALMPR